MENAGSITLGAPLFMRERHPFRKINSSLAGALVGYFLLAGALVGVGSSAFIGYKHICIYTAYVCVYIYIYIYI